MKTWLMKIIFRIAYGEVEECIVSREAGYISEVAYKDLKGRLLGYWAFGSFNPHLPVNENNFQYITLVEIS